jgi:hypothetical protein
MSIFKRLWLDKKIDLIFEYLTEEILEHFEMESIFRDIQISFDSARERRDVSEWCFVERSRKLLQSVAIVKGCLSGKALVDALALEDYLISIARTDPMRPPTVHPDDVVSL